MVVKTGQRIPVDGMIEEGQAALDESDLTGESMPVDRSAGDRVISGTFNRAGYLKIRAERVGGDSTLARMIRLVEQAGQSKAPLRVWRTGYAISLSLRSLPLPWCRWLGGWPPGRVFPSPSPGPLRCW